MKVSIVIPVYYNEKSLKPLYADLKEKFIRKIDYDYEIIMVNDGSMDGSYTVMKELAAQDSHIRTISLSRNFGSHAACLCGLVNSTGDCAIIKAADLQEPTELLLDMVENWRQGNNVVLAVRNGRDESIIQTFFAEIYYKLVQKLALPQMPDQGFDVYLVDRKVITVLENLDEKDSALTGQILWSGFKTGVVYYHRLAREIGESKWTFKKKVRLVMDTLFSFTTVPITFVLCTGLIFDVIAFIWAVYLIIVKIMGVVPVQGWTTLMVINLFCFGTIMLALGVIGEYIWRSFDASRNRPLYIIEEDSKEQEVSR